MFSLFCGLFCNGFHFGKGCLHIRCAEGGGSYDKYICSRFCTGTDGSAADTAVHLDVQHMLDIQVDGGIGSATIGACAKAGANVFVVGTASFRAPDMKAALSEMKSIAEKAAE